MTFSLYLPLLFFSFTQTFPVLYLPQSLYIQRRYLPWQNGIASTWRWMATELRVWTIVIWGRLMKVLRKQRRDAPTSKPKPSFSTRFLRSLLPPPTIYRLFSSLIRPTAKRNSFAVLVVLTSIRWTLPEVFEPNANVWTSAVTTLCMAPCVFSVGEKSEFISTNDRYVYVWCDVISSCARCARSHRTYLTSVSKTFRENHFLLLLLCTRLQLTKKCGRWLMLRIPFIICLFNLISSHTKV